MTAPADLKWRVPIANAKFSEQIAFPPSDLFLSYLALKRALAGGLASDIVKMRSPGFRAQHRLDMFTDGGTTVEEQNSLRGCHNYINALQGVLQGWKFIVTRNGYVGVASNNPKVGDSIALFSGGVVPFVLRKSIRIRNKGRQRETRDNVPPRVSSIRRSPREESLEPQMVRPRHQQIPPLPPLPKPPLMQRLWHSQAKQPKTKRERSQEREHDMYRLVGECYIHGIMEGEAWERGDRETDIRLY